MRTWRDGVFHSAYANKRSLRKLDFYLQLGLALEIALETSPRLAAGETTQARDSSRLS